MKSNYNVLRSAPLNVDTSTWPNNLGLTKIQMNEPSYIHIQILIRTSQEICHLALV